jgi:hypothetical protein
MAPNGHADPIERCPLLGEQRKTSTRSEHFADSDIGSGAQIGIVTLPRASITAHVRLANGRFVMVYPVVPSMNEAERDSKYLEACDFGKPLRPFRRHQS